MANSQEHQALWIKDTINLADTSDAKDETISVLVREHFKKGTIRLPYPFNAMYKETLRTPILLTVDSGVQYRANYEKETGTLTNIDKFLKNLKIDYLSPVMLTYCGKSCFSVKVFMPIGLELPFDMKRGMFLYDMHCISYGRRSNTQTDLLDHDQNMIFTHRGLAVTKFNLYAHAVKPIVIQIDSCHIAAHSVSVEMDEDYLTYMKNATTRSLFCVVLGQLDFGIEIGYEEGSICFKKGWREFVKGSGMEDGEILFLQPDKDFEKIRACLVSDFDCDKLGIGGELAYWNFLSVANRHSLNTGIIGVPSILSYKAGHLINSANSCTLPNGEKISVTYVLDESCFYGFQEFFKEACIEEDDVIYVKNIASSSWSVSLIRKNGIGYLTGANCDNESRIYGAKSYNLRSRSKESDDQSRIDDIEEAKRMFMDIEEGSKVQSDENIGDENPPDDDNIAGEVVQANDLAVQEDFVIEQENMRYTATLTLSNLDKKSHGLYIPRWLKPTGRDWIAGEGVILRTQIADVNVRLVVNNGKARFSAGWNEFVRRNNLSVNDTLILTMMNEGASYVFSVEQNIN